MKYKVGDKVKIIDQIQGHEFEIGTVVTITELYPDSTSPHYEARTKADRWWVADNEIESL